MKQMKTITILTLTLLGLNSVVMSSHGQTKNSEMVVIKTNIHCDHCKECSSCSGKIERDLGFDKGIKLVKLDEKEMTITVTYNPKRTNEDEIRKTISQYGFDADSVKADPVAYGKLDECCKKVE